MRGMFECEFREAANCNSSKNCGRYICLVAGLIAALTVEYGERVAPVELSASLWLFPILTPILM